MNMKPREVNGEEPPAAVAAADVVIAPTFRSLTHTNARIRATETGTRIATMPGITKEMFSRGAMTADYSRVEQLTGKVAELLTQARTARIEKDGYTLTLQLSGREGKASPGIYKQPGACGNLPSGEGYIAPLEDGSFGEMIIDGSMVGIGRLQSPLKVTVQNGKLKKIEGRESEKLEILLRSEANATLGELGIGTNDAAILNGVILEDEKVYGTVHIAFGTNTSFGGTNKAECHMDGVILRPTVYLDDTLLIADGEFVFPQEG